MKQVVTGILIVLIPAALIALGIGVYALAQQNQALQDELAESRARSADLQAQIEERDKEAARLHARIEELQAQIDALKQQLRDAGQEPVSVISLENAAAMDAIEQAVQEMRGLAAIRPVTRTLMTSEELRAYVVDLQEKNYSQADARSDALTLAAFDLVEPDFELYDFLTDLYSEQIAGFYDPDRDRLYVIAQPGDLSVLERITFAHEFDHALQDQHFDLAGLGFSNDKALQIEDADRQLAYQALVEGDGALLMQQWAMDTLSLGDQLAMMSAAQDMPVFASAPRVFRESLMFPYLSGMTFVLSLQLGGGWPAVDAAFDDPPVSSEQILHPFAYPDDRPIPITLPPLTGTLPAGWRLADENTLGEFMLRQYLTEHISRTASVERAAEGWGGDRYAVYVSPGAGAATPDTFEYVLVISQAWDSERDAEEFAEVYREYLRVRLDLDSSTRTQAGIEWWIGPVTTYFAQRGDRTLIVAGPDEATVQPVVETVSP
ncbi:MAG TPA: hypothetical protein VFL17_05655 [Anaerolineae bacterium]|nr:hypothetical protein [Anaerolineae bacterium]